MNVTLTTIDNCPNLPLNTTLIAGAYAYTLFLQSLSNLQSCGFTYLRPDAGGALFPYVATVAQIIFHLPACIIRLARWEKVQAFSLLVAAINITITTQAFISSKLRPEEVLVWTPITLILDAGAMLQIYIVIIEKITFRRFIRTLLGALAQPFVAMFSRLRASFVPKSNNIDSLDPNSPDRTGLPIHELNVIEPPKAVVSTVVVSEFLEGTTTGNEQAELSADHIVPVPSQMTSLSPSRQTSTRGSRNEKADTHTSILHVHDMIEDVRSETFAAVLALLILLAILILQFFGLAHTHSGLKVQNLQATWCSPFFQPQALAILDDCNLYPVVASLSQGIGCIKLPATQQKTWLLITAIILWLSLFCEVFDFCLLFFNDGNNKGCHRTVRLQRPWLTTFFGMIILIILTTFGAQYANHLPDGISERVLVFRHDSSLNAHSVCEAHLKSPGLRGAIIGYCDGLFSSWGEFYLGKNTRMGSSGQG